MDTASSGFQARMLCVLEQLVTAAVDEIERRVAERCDVIKTEVSRSCDVIKVEVSQSRRDIALLRKRSEQVEREVMKARRKVLYPPPAAERSSPSVEVSNQNTQSSEWDRQTDTEEQHQPQQCVAVGAEDVFIKAECAEEDIWKIDSEDRLISEAEQPPCFEASHHSQHVNFPAHPHCAAPGSPPVHPTDTSKSSASEQQLNTNQHQEEISIKHENQELDPDQNTSPVQSAYCSVFLKQEVTGQQWPPSNLCGENNGVDPTFSYAEQQQFEPTTSLSFPSQSAEEDIAPRIHSVGKSNLVLSAARAKRRARTFGLRRQEQHDGHSSASAQINTLDHFSVCQQAQHQYREVRSLNEDVHLQIPAQPSPYSSCGFNSSVRRSRAARRSNGKNSCSVCGRCFTKSSHLLRHAVVHSGEKPHRCSVCGNSFTQRSNLLRHAVIHSGEKPYGCSLCGKSFTQRSSLKWHEKKAH